MPATVAALVGFAIGIALPSTLRAAYRRRVLHARLLHLHVGLLLHGRLLLRRRCELHRVFRRRLDRPRLHDRLDGLLLHHNTLLAGLGAPTFTKPSLRTHLMDLAPRILPFAEPVWERLDEARRAGTRILFEGAQAVMLDVDHGTYPYVTSSNTVAATAAAGAGIGPAMIGFVLGIAKAYSTRVGSGPFPTELADATGQLLGDRGHEFGTVTGRRRRCGWFDAVLVRQAVKVGGIQGLALTKLDVLDGLTELKICTGYRVGGDLLRRLPAAPGLQAAAEPVYETLEGWTGSTRGARSWADLSAPAVKYVRRIEELTDAPVTLVSTSPERDDTILVRDPFE